MPAGQGHQLSDMKLDAMKLAILEARFKRGGADNDEDLVNEEGSGRETLLTMSRNNLSSLSQPTLTTSSRLGGGASTMTNFYTEQTAKQGNARKRRDKSALALAQQLTDEQYLGSITSWPLKRLPIQKKQSKLRRRRRPRLIVPLEKKRVDAPAPAPLVVEEAPAPQPPSEEEDEEEDDFAPLAPGHFKKEKKKKKAPEKSSTRDFGSAALFVLSDIEKAKKPYIVVSQERGADLLLNWGVLVALGARSAKLRSKVPQRSGPPACIEPEDPRMRRRSSMQLESTKALSAAFIQHNVLLFLRRRAVDLIKSSLAKILASGGVTLEKHWEQRIVSRLRFISRAVRMVQGGWRAILRIREARLELLRRLWALVEKDQHERLLHFRAETRTRRAGCAFRTKMDGNFKKKKKKEDDPNNWVEKGKRELRHRHRLLGALDEQLVQLKVLPEATTKTRRRQKNKGPLFCESSHRDRILNTYVSNRWAEHGRELAAYLERRQQQNGAFDIADAQILMSRNEEEILRRVDAKCSSLGGSIMANRPPFILLRPTLRREVLTLVKRGIFEKVLMRRLAKCTRRAHEHSAFALWRSKAAELEEAANKRRRRAESSTSAAHQQRSTVVQPSRLRRFYNPTPVATPYRKSISPTDHLLTMSASGSARGY